MRAFRCSQSSFIAAPGALSLAISRPGAQAIERKRAWQPFNVKVQETVTSKAPTAENPVERANITGWRKAPQLGR